jgi:hypothetical protein
MFGRSRAERQKEREDQLFRFVRATASIQRDGLVQELQDALTAEHIEAARERREGTERRRLATSLHAEHLATHPDCARCAEVAGLPIRRKVVVNLKSEDAIKGVLYKADRQVLVLRDAWFHKAGDAPRKPIDGEALIQRTEIAFMQILP